MCNQNIPAKLWVTRNLWHNIAHVVPIWDMFPEFMANDLKVDYLIICIICDTDSVNKLTLQMYTLHKYK